MTSRRFCFAAAQTICLALFLCMWNLSTSLAQVHVQVDRSSSSTFFQLEKVSPPAVNDDAAQAQWVVARGTPDPNGASIDAVHDGKIPSSDDSPRENFFFAPGVSKGLIAVDLGRSIEVAEIATYSWHAGTRGPQVFSLYASNGESPAFQWQKIDNEVDLTTLGWKPIAKVDTRSNDAMGGQHASRISDASGSLGSYRYLLLEVSPTETNDPFGNTFFSEIDVVSTENTRLQRIEIPETQTIRFASEDGLYSYTIDVTAAPELASWSESELKPVILDWYPRIVKLLPSDGYEAPKKVLFRYLPSVKMEGIPAYAQGGTISMNAGWMQREKNREARGAVVHEMVHVVQSYQGRRQRSGRRMPTPGWIVEGIPDYIRWFLYEPQSRGALLSKASRANAKHDASYRVSANFIDWVIRTQDSDGTLLQKLNAAAREGRYSSELWETLTGKTEDDLARQWKTE